MPLYNMDQIKKCNEEGGFTYFSPGNIRGFSSRFLSPVLTTPHGAIFVESTRSPSNPRKYTVRHIDERTGEIKTLGGFEEYRSASGAKARARREQKLMKEEMTRVNPFRKCIDTYPHEPGGLTDTCPWCAYLNSYRVAPADADDADVFTVREEPRECAEYLIHAVANGFVAREERIEFFRVSQNRPQYRMRVQEGRRVAWEELDETTGNVVDRGVYRL